MLAENSSSGGGEPYSVREHDSLWKISGDVYHDSFAWPLIYINNRDKIKDPDLIKPEWNLSIKKDFADEKVKDAVAKAKETPRFEPHSTPRKQLPIEY